MPTRSRDIRDQSRKLSEVAPNFGGFLTLPNFRGRAFQKLYARYHPCLAVLGERVAKKKKKKERKKTSLAFYKTSRYYRTRAA